ncbi:flagellar FlbD family protein [Acidicapsa ligni]|uniref:flagellar FlbD family protein n=1 Tax=Acidicapsa ligni TaxID=542300 RepID=UPI0021DF7AFA|nr:flagellar FlbD family protein [Acidicapsa ligni]
MIEVTRLNGNPMMVNSDLIKIAEASPDTMLTLIHGEKLIVRESCAEVVEKVLAYRARLLAEVATRGVDAGELQIVAGLTSIDAVHLGAATMNSNLNMDSCPGAVDIATASRTVSAINHQ